MIFLVTIFKRTVGIFLVLICTLWACSFQSPLYGNNLDEEINRFEELVDLYHLILQESLHGKKGDELIQSAMSGMVKSLDPFSEILTRTEYEMLEAQVIGEYPGIGITIQKDGNEYIVTQVYQNSPAALAGIKPGVIVLKIKGILLDGKSENELKKLIFGKVGSKLNMTFITPENRQGQQVVSLKLDWIKTNSVDFFEFKSGVALFQVHQFQKNTSEEIHQYLRKKQYKAVILDLRNNPGGLLLSAVEVAELFIGVGDIVETRDRNNQLIERYVSRRKIAPGHPSLVVLINRFSASAAEIVAGAVKDRKEGILVGEISFGKGVIQSVIPIGKRFFVKITTAKYYTPSGISFDKIGITPEYTVTDSTNIIRYGKDDKIYQKALDIIESE